MIFVGDCHMAIHDFRVFVELCVIVCFDFVYIFVPLLHGVASTTTTSCIYKENQEGVNKQ